jgi:GTPase
LGYAIQFVWRASRPKPHLKYFIGPGQLESIKEIIGTVKVDAVLFNVDLSAQNQAQLEKVLDCQVLDRTEVILHIFALHAHSFEGKLQVELAQLQHLATRLTRRWQHLERQRGGGGFMAGPGEKQIEIDRRLINKRVKSIKQRIKKIALQREAARKNRKRGTAPVVALVGYTNAGKSSLFNAMTKSKTLVEDALFATLDTKMRRCYMPDTGSIIIADTVGFIQGLPHSLIEAFHATLEELRYADILLHVIDITDAEMAMHIIEVEKVLREIIPDFPLILRIYNKMDLMPDAILSESQHEAEQGGDVHWVSASSGQGIPELLRRLDQACSATLRK